MKKTSSLLAAFAAAQLFIHPLAVRAGDDNQDSKTTVTPAPPEKAPPLPLHTIEGVGGILITPVAYLVNPGGPGTTFGLPAFSTTFVKANQKNVESFATTETLFQRVELGFAASRFGTGTLNANVFNATGVQLGRSDVFLYNLNARVLALPEGSFGLPLPAVTLGAAFKFNDGISDINNNLGGALSNIGYKRDHGVDFTITATKAFPNVFGRTLLVTTGVRFSEAAQLGYVGFGNSYNATFEGNLAYSITDWLWLAGEFRQKTNPYTRIGNLVRPESDWWTVGTAFILNKHATLTVGYGHFGNVLDTIENKAWALQIKYEL